VTKPFAVLVMSTPVGPLGSGVGGGVEATLSSLVRGLSARGHRVEVVAPAGSRPVGVPMHCPGGDPQPPAQFVDRSTVTETSGSSVLVNMWAAVRDLCRGFDVVLNLAYDALPFEESFEVERPVAHIVSMASLTDEMDAAIDNVLRAAPATVAMHTRAQADTFVHGSRATIIGGGVDVEGFVFVDRAHADGRVAFVGRVSPEKGLRDVVRACRLAGRPLHVWGYMQHDDEWAASVEGADEDSAVYRGFVDARRLGAELGECTALVMAPKWVEAFGNVAVEAMACGVPVVSYRRGGPAEVVVDGENGFLVDADDVVGLAAALGRVGALSRRACRTSAAENHSVDALAGRVEAWLDGVLGGRPRVDFAAPPLSF